MAIFKNILVALLLTTAIGCGGGSSSETTGGGSGQTVSATLASIQSQIFTPTCATAGCHSSGSASGGLILEAGSSFSNLVNVNSTGSSFKRVASGSPDKSYLINKLEGTGSGTQMPQGTSPLTAAEIQTIKDWITGGALNN